MRAADLRPSSYHHLRVLRGPTASTGVIAFNPTPPERSLSQGFGLVTRNYTYMLKYHFRSLHPSHLASSQHLCTGGRKGGGVRAGGADEKVTRLCRGTGALRVFFLSAFPECLLRLFFVDVVFVHTRRHFRMSRRSELISSLNRRTQAL